MRAGGVPTAHTPARYCNRAARRRCKTMWAWLTPLLSNVLCDTQECFADYRGKLSHFNASMGGTRSEFGRDGPVSKTAGSYWWDDPKIPGAFKVQKIDDRLYPRWYFEGAQGQSSPYYLTSAIELTTTGRTAKGASQCRHARPS